MCIRDRPRRLPREDRRAEVGEEVRVSVGVGVRVGPVEFSYNSTTSSSNSMDYCEQTTVQHNKIYESPKIASESTALLNHDAMYCRWQRVVQNLKEASEEAKQRSDLRE